LEVEEISNNFWEGNARRSSGDIVTCQGVDPDEIMERLEIDFWQIELLHIDNISSLIPIYFKEKAAYEGKKICVMEQPECFGSWIITKGIRQVIYDGKESWFVFRCNKFIVDWADEAIIRLEEITPEKIFHLYYRLIGHAKK
jgi:hypothetical protein